MKKKGYLICAMIVIVLLGCKEALPSLDVGHSEQIRLNQLGYYPNATKKAVIVENGTLTDFKVMDIDKKKIVFSGSLSKKMNWDLSGEQVRIADFSEVTEEGNYQLLLDDFGHSYPFEIRKNVLHTAFVASIKALYYQRASMPLEEKYAGKWHRARGHSDDSVRFHPSSGKKVGFKASPKGWYDAGDYGKYVLNASFPLGQFFLLQEEYPGIIDDGILNIPESGNGKSDYLDELKYEMDWVLTMQDTDGGLFHKLTTKDFEDMIMPDKAIKERYIIGKGTAATLDFAAAAAKAYRVFDKTDSIYALQCLSASKKAYEWAMENPNVAFENPSDIRTGQYGDTDFSDEFFWAGAELYVATRDTSYLDKLHRDALNLTYKPGDGWTSYMRFLGVFSLLRYKEGIPPGVYDDLKNRLLESADSLVAKAKKTPYFQPLDDFQWGSNGDVLNTAMIMAQAYRLEPKPEYLEGIQQIADYIFGNNALGYSYLTGHGDKTPMFIHHRQSAADTIKAPVPGLLSGGPNSSMQDANSGAVYPGNAPPMKSWVDQEPSYASNEICLNWNAPLTYILGFLEQESD
ncbi:MAG: glycoside hydrolase family 9 protein [Bacteroidota bacterium]